MSSGRKWKKYGKLLNTFSLFFSLFPRKVSLFFFTFFRHTPGLPGLGLRYALLKGLCKSCGENIALFPGAYLSFTEKMRLGDNISIHEGCNLGALGELTVGNNVMIAQGTSILTTEHDFSTTRTSIREAAVIPSSVSIGDDVWIGAHVVITAGVTIGSGSVIGAGSVVTKDIPPNAVAYGVPAKVAKYRKEVL